MFDGLIDTESRLAVARGLGKRGKGVKKYKWVVTK